MQTCLRLARKLVIHVRKVLCSNTRLGERVEQMLDGLREDICIDMLRDRFNNMRADMHVDMCAQSAGCTDNTIK